MRVILGLDHPTKGRATINGVAYRDLKEPLREVGALLDAKSVHPGRTARNHLRALAASNKIKRSRVDDVLEFVGITSVANKKVGGFFSRYEPAPRHCRRIARRSGRVAIRRARQRTRPGGNSLDPGILSLPRQRRPYGFCQFAPHERNGRQRRSNHCHWSWQFITQGSVDELTANAIGTVLVRTSDNTKLTSIIERLNGTVHQAHDRELTVGLLTCDEIGQAAFAAGITVLELTPQRASLEDVFMELTAARLSSAAATSRRCAMSNEVTLMSVAKSEWIKFRTVRSTNVSVFIFVFLTIGLGVLISWLVVATTAICRWPSD